MNRVALVLVVSVALVTASTIWVNSSGEDFDECGAQDSPCATIQYAVNLATNSNETFVSVNLDGHVFLGIDNTNVTISNVESENRPNIEIVGQFSDTAINCDGSRIAFFTDYTAANTSIYSSVTFKNLIFQNCFYYENDSLIQRGGGAIQIDNSDAQIVNCQFLNCYGVYGGAINVGRPAVLPLVLSIATGIVINSSFVNNYAIRKGGAIYVNKDSTLVVMGSSFVNNHAHDGGAIHSTSGQVFSHTYILESTFNNNWADHAGGALHIEMPSAVVNSSFFNNSANHGGAIFGNYEDSFEQQIAILNGNFSENYAHEAGGAIYFTYTNINMSNCNVDHNSAVNVGGIYIENSYNVYIYNSSIFENSGVGLYLNSTSASLNGSVIADNEGGNVFDSETQLTCSCGSCADCGNIGGCILDGNECTCFADSNCATSGTQSCSVKSEEFSCSCEENYSGEECATFSAHVSTGGALIKVIIAFFVVFGVIMLAGIAGYLYRRKKKHNYEAVPLMQ